ncbi:MAG TPA: peroxiredoxin [Paracoccaceae bacterium]|nr:peroxiredoxin [Paracoccaceae bacterium]
MTLSVGDRLPQATLLRFGENGVETVELSSLTAGRKVVIFALPGAYTRTCSSAHVPSFIRTRAKFGDKGVDDVICIAVNDPFVMAAWADATGGAKAGIRFLADPGGDYTNAVGMAFTAPPVGFYGRSRRYALCAEDGVVKVLHVEEGTGVCDTSGGEAMLAAI